MVEFQDPLNAWLGEIPADWDTRRLKYIFSIKKDIAGEEGHTVLSVTQRGIVPKKMDEKGQFAADYSNYQLVNIGDFVMNHMDLLTGWVDISQYAGVTSPDYRVFILDDKTKYCPEYYKYIFQLCYKHRIFYGLGQGVAGFGRWRLPADMFLNFVLPVPQYEKQKQIADFLDNKISSADQLIEETEKVIESYKTMRASIISEHVFQKKKNVPKCESGLTWIKELPKGWESRRLTTLFDFGKGLAITKADLTEEGVPVISYGQIHSKQNKGTSLNPELLRFVPRSIAESDPGAKLNKGDFVFADTSEDLDGCGNCIYVDTEDEVFAGYHTIIFRAKEMAHSRYLSYLFKTDEWRTQIRSKVIGVKLFSISRKILKASKVVLPPENEQKDICDYLDGQCAIIDSLIEEKQKLIEDINKMKISLIYEVVTGKRKVV